MHRKITGALLAIVLTPGIILSAFAETSAEDAYKYRSAVMRTLGGHITATSMTVRGLVEDRGFLLRHARGLANGAAELNYLFPTASNFGESEALPIIWEEPEEFEQAIAKAQAATEVLVDAVASEDQDAIGAAFREVGGACKGCHDRFRKEH